MHFIPVILAALFLNFVASKLAYSQSYCWWVGVGSFIVLGFFAQAIGAQGQRHKETMSALQQDPDCHPLFQEHYQTHQRLSGVTSCFMVAYLATGFCVLVAFVLWLFS